jgi:hypothetical protein
MTTVVISQPMFFPWVGMFEQIALADVYVHYDDVQFSKGSFTNRVQIKTAKGPNWLTVPLDEFRLGQRIDEVRSDPGDWRDRHRRQLSEAYRGAPHVDDMLRLVDAEYADPAVPLLDLLTGSMERIAAQLGAAAGTEFHRSSELDIGGSGWPRVLEVVQRFGGDTYVTGHGARRYLDGEAFETAGVEVRYMDYACTPYPQQHGDFTPYVSALDLVANVGEDAARFLAPRTVDWRTFHAEG